MDSKYNLQQIMPGTCSLCGRPLGALDNIARMPMFEASLDETKIQGLAGQLVHYRCLLEFGSLNRITELALNAVRSEFADGAILVNGENFAAHGYVCEDIEFAHGILAMPRSTMIYDDLLGPNVKACEIRARTPQICSILHVLSQPSVAIGEHELIPNGKLPPLLISVDEDEHGDAWMNLYSNHPSSIDLLCRISTSDIKEIQQASARMAM